MHLKLSNVLFHSHRPDEIFSLVYETWKEYDDLRILNERLDNGYKHKVLVDFMV